jgi:2'-5' RNA ligase
VRTENVKKAERPRYWITYLLKDLAVGETFKPDALHLTIITWFVTELPDEKVIKSFKQEFSKIPRFEVIVGKQDVFANKRKIPINLIEPSNDLKALHQKGLSWFSKLEARWAVKNPHVDNEFIPHIRRRVGHNVSEGEKITISSLSLVRAFRRGDDLRTVAAKVVLK